MFVEIQHVCIVQLAFVNVRFRHEDELRKVHGLEKLCHLRLQQRDALQPIRLFQKVLPSVHQSRLKCK